MVQWSQINTQEMYDDAQRSYTSRRIATKDFAYLCLREDDPKPADADTIGDCYGEAPSGIHYYTGAMTRVAFDALEQDDVGVDDETPPPDIADPPPEEPPTSTHYWIMHDMTDNTFFNTVDSTWGALDVATRYSDAQHDVMGDSALATPVTDGNVVQWLEQGV